MIAVKFITKQLSYSKNNKINHLLNNSNIQTLIFTLQIKYCLVIMTALTFNKTIIMQINSRKISNNFSNNNNRKRYPLRNLKKNIVKHWNRQYHQIQVRLILKI